MFILTNTCGLVLGVYENMACSEEAILEYQNESSTADPGLLLTKVDYYKTINKKAQNKYTVVWMSY